MTFIVIATLCTGTCDTPRTVTFEAVDAPRLYCEMALWQLDLRSRMLPGERVSEVRCE